MRWDRIKRGEKRIKKSFLILPLHWGKHVYWFETVELEQVWTGSYWELMGVNGYRGGDYD